MSFPNQLLTIMQQDTWNVRTKQNKNQKKQPSGTLQSPAEGWNQGSDFLCNGKENAKKKKRKENGSFLRTRKHVQIESKLIQVIVKKKKENKKRKDQYDLNFNIKF